MALLSKDISLQLQLEWYKIRDLFFGDNMVGQNIILSLKLAKSCKHPDAEWLSKMCIKAQTKQDIYEIFQNPDWNDARALFFAARLSSVSFFVDSRVLCRAAELEYAPAQNLLSLVVENVNKKFEYATLAACQGERYAFFNLGNLFLYGKGCQVNLVKAKECFLISSKLGDVFSMVALANASDDFDSHKWYWLVCAAKLGYTFPFLSVFVKAIRIKPQNNVVFVIGQGLHGKINESARLIFGINVNFDERIGPAKDAVVFYLHQIEAYQCAVHEWTKVGRRLKVCRDIRKVIGMLIWNSRGEALY